MLCIYTRIYVFVCCVCVCVCVHYTAESESDAERVLFSYGFGTNLPTTAKRRAQQRYIHEYIGTYSVGIVLH